MAGLDGPAAHDGGGLTWNGAKRCDGLAVAQSVDGWVILPAGEGGAIIDRCPACERPIGFASEAKRIADRAFPLPRPTDGAVAA